MARKKPAPKVVPDADPIAAFYRDIKAHFSGSDVLDEQLKPRQGNPRNLGPRIPDGATMAADMVRGAQNNAEKWLRNTLAPRKDPLEEAKKANASWKNGVQEAVREDRFVKGLNAVDEAEMIRTIEATGAAGYAAGVAKREGKITKAFDALSPLLAAAVKQLDAMPRDTKEQRRAKVLKNLDLMEELGKAYKAVKGR